MQGGIMCTKGVISAYKILAKIEKRSYERLKKQLFKVCEENEKLGGKTHHEVRQSFAMRVECPECNSSFFSNISFSNFK